MATLLQDNEENKDQIPGQQAPSSAAPTTGGTASQPLYTAQKQPANSGRFTNIQKYLTANQGGGQQIAQGIESKANDEAAGVRAGIQAAQSKFQEAYNPEQQRLASAQPFVQQTIQQAGTQALTPEQIAQFRQYSTGQGSYNQLSGLQNVPTVDNLQNTAKNAQTEAGRFGLLQQTFGQPTYSRGQQKLDQLLLQGQQPGLLQTNLQNLAQQTSQEQSLAQKQAADQAQGLKDQALAAQTAATTGLTGAQTNLENDVNTRATTGQQQSDELKDLISRAFGPGLNNQDEVNKALQLAQQTGMNLNQNVYGIENSEKYNPEQFFNNQTFNAQTVSTPEERARAAALAQLSGGEQTFLAGTAPDQAASLNNIFNQDAFQNAVGTRKTEYHSLHNPVQPIYNSLVQLPDLQKTIQNYFTQEDAVQNNPTFGPIATADRLQKIDALKKQERQAIEDARQQGLDPNVYNQLIESDILKGNSNSSGGMHAAIPKAGDIFKNYLGQFYGAKNQLSSLNDQYKPNETLNDILNRIYKKPNNKVHL